MGAPGPDAARVTFHPLEIRHDRGEWIVGQSGNGQVIAVPEVGLSAIRLLMAGHTIEQTRRRLLAEAGRDIDVAAFIKGLAALGFVASMAGRHFPRPPVHESLTGLRPHHVRWTLSPVLHTVVLAAPLVGLATLVLRKRSLPSWGDLFWSEYGTVNLLLQSFIAWCLIGLHELAHLVTARAAGASARVRLSTRLQFLVAQTEVSGMWLKSRRERLVVYLAGLALDGVVCSGCLLAMAFEVDSPLPAVVVMTLLISCANQAMIFMRTDLYFVMQDLSGCRNLYSDASAYIRWLAARLARRRVADPLGRMRASERWFVRGYAAVAVVGTAVCVFVGLRLLLDVTLPMLLRSVARLRDGADPLLRLDSLLTVGILIGLQALWAHLWWRRHGHRIRVIKRLVWGCTAGRRKEARAETDK
ncbi:hypothetical protein [Streptomyces sp. CC219B]|uniref:hypothetical protein n=1 Tax=Streptomyces sp. CC219B TaxID=3044574 RepID=UPI0024A85F82|nr:hypothetical protein [Streptomyces sp. CC219B]